MKSQNRTRYKSYYNKFDRQNTESKTSNNFRTYNKNKNQDRILHSAFYLHKLHSKSNDKGVKNYHTTDITED